MKIGILYGQKLTPERDMRHPELGNPGVGGTQFCIGMLVRYLSEYEEYRITVYQYNDTIFPEKVKIKKIENFEQALQDASDQDAFICVQPEILEDYHAMSRAACKIVLWVHSPFKEGEAAKVADCANIKRVVFVGRQQYDQYIDHRICKKATYVFNMFYGKLAQYQRKDDYEKIVTYMGSIIPSKGFHILAEQWKKIVEQVPDAELYVIGSGSLYSKGARLGEYGIADSEYEKRFMPYLTDEQGKILNSVHFCGVLGQEKYEIFNKTAVGIINPSACTETFGLSAVEMEACGIPIVTKAKNGLLDTVRHHETGLMYHKEKKLADDVIRLLQDRKLNQTLGKNAQKFVCDAFDPEKLTKEWMKVLEEVKMDVPAVYQKPTGFFSNQGKWLRIINRRIQAVFGTEKSLGEIKAVIKKCVGKK